MSGWRCGIGDCKQGFEDVESLIIHQTTEHDKHECQVCGTLIPDGYFAIRHVFDEHTRAQYVRAYDADSAAVRRREEIQADSLERVAAQFQKASLEGGETHLTFLKRYEKKLATAV
jgi:hypothetical protein